MGSLSPSHWLVVIIAGLALLLIFNGSRKIPELARGLGRGVRIFKSELEELKHDEHQRESHQQGSHQVPAEPPVKLPNNRTEQTAIPQSSEIL